MAIRFKTRPEFGLRLTAAACAQLFAEQLATDQAEVNGNKAKIWTGETVLSGSEAGTKRASSIANCEAGNVKDGVTIDDMTGTFKAPKYGPFQRTFGG